MRHFTRILFFLPALAFAQIPPLPAPSVVSWFPQAVNAGAPGFTMRVDGTRFTQNSRVVWRHGTVFATTLATQFVSETQLNAAVPAGLLEQSGTVPLAVTQVSDGILLTSNQFNFAIVASVTISSPCPLPNAVVGRAYEFQFTPDGGVPPYVWALNSGTLPPGLAFGPSGLLRGVATDAQSTSFSVQVRDAQNTIATKSCSIRSVIAADGLVITQLDPGGVLAGSQAVSLRIRGDGFTAGSTVVWNFGNPGAVDLTPRFDGDPRFLTVTIPLNLLATAGTFPIVVRQVVLTRQIFSNVENFVVSAPVQVTSQCPLRDATLNAVYAERLTAAGGFPGYTWSLVQGLLPAGLVLRSSGDLVGTPTEAGVFDFTVSATDTRNNAGSRACSLRVTGPLSVLPASLTFTMDAGGALPPQQLVSVAGASTGLPLTVTALSQGNWLRVATDLQQTPTLLRVAVDPGNLVAGTYQSVISVASESSTNRLVQIPVTLQIGAPRESSLVPLPVALRFAAGRGSGRLPDQSIMVSNPGPQPLGFNVTLVPSVTWLSVSPDSSIARAAVPVALRVRANAEGLTQGTYRTAIQLTAAGRAPVNIPVTLSVSLATETILVPQSGLTFTAVEGGPAPSGRALQVISTGPGGFFWEVAPTTITGRTWLTVNPGSNASRPGVTLGSEARVNVDGLAADIHFGDLRITSPSADNSPRLVSAVLHLLPPGAAIAPELSATALLFKGTAGGAAPPTQTLLVRNMSRSPVQVDFIASGDTRLFATNAVGSRSLGSGESRRIEVAANTVLAGTGVHRAALQIQSSGDQQVRSVPLVLIATPLPEVRCTPTRLIPVVVSHAEGFQAAAGLPSPVEALVSDDCGQPLNAGNGSLISATPAGVFPLYAVGEGRFTGTWPVAAVAASAASLTVQIEDPDRSLQGAATVAGFITPNPGVPVVGNDAVVSSASLTRGEPLAMGGLFTAFGASLAEVTGVASGFPLPSQIFSTRLSAGERDLPLYLVSPQQVNAQMPYDLAPNVLHQVAVRAGTRRSLYHDVAVAPARPAVFVMVDAENPTVPLSAANPVSPGKVIVIYCEGLGGVTQPVLAGQAAPVAPLAETQTPVTVSIGGQPAQVLFAGLTPGLAGLYQVNVVVPPNVAAGTTAPLVVTTAGQSSLPVALPVR